MHKDNTSIYKTICLLLLIIFYSSCNNNKQPRYLGKVSIAGVDNIFFKLYQEDKYESSVGIFYEIVDNQDTVIQGLHFLIGTSDFDRDNTKDFYTGFQDSIIYLSFINANDVYAMYDLRANRNSGDAPGETLREDSTLIKKLKVANPNLNFQ